MNNNIDLTLSEFKEKNVNPKYMILIWQHLYKMSGLEFPLLEELTIDRELYEAQQIAQKLGIYSKGNKPHSQAIKAILDKVGIAKDEKDNVPFIQHGHIDTTIKYSKKVIPKIEKWLIDNNFPSVIATDKNNLKVIYENKKEITNKKKIVFKKVLF